MSSVQNGIAETGSTGGHPTSGISRVRMHSFDVTPERAIEIQEELRRQVIVRGKPGQIRFVAGVDVGFRDRTTTAAVAVLCMPTLELVRYACASRPTGFPYIPGLLSFREIPVILEALRRITAVPDVLLCDGQGIAHPRRIGIASHLGVLTGLRTIGVAKSRLIGVHAELPLLKGAWVPLRDGCETIGAVLRTREAVKPLFISCGHRLDLASAIEIVMCCVTRFRLPEPLRWAHRIAGNPGAVPEKWLA